MRGGEKRKSEWVNVSGREGEWGGGGELGWDGREAGK